MKDSNLKTGRLGEELARKFLEKKGYKVIGRNLRLKFAEVDLLCQNKRDKVLVEVRTKRGDNFGSPEESLTKRKLKKLRLAAMAIGAQKVDAVCVALGENNKPKRIAHHEDIC